MAPHHKALMVCVSLVLLLLFPQITHGVQPNPKLKDPSARLKLFQAAGVEGSGTIKPPPVLSNDSNSNTSSVLPPVPSPDASGNSTADEIGDTAHGTGDTTDGTTGDGNHTATGTGDTAQGTDAGNPTATGTGTGTGDTTEEGGTTDTEQGMGSGNSTTEEASRTSNGTGITLTGTGTGNTTEEGETTDTAQGMGSGNSTTEETASTSNGTGITLTGTGTGKPTAQGTEATTSSGTSTSSATGTSSSSATGTSSSSATGTITSSATGTSSSSATGTSSSSATGSITSSATGTITSSTTGTITSSSTGTSSSSATGTSSSSATGTISSPSPSASPSPSDSTSPSPSSTADSGIDDRTTGTAEDKKVPLPDPDTEEGGFWYVVRQNYMLILLMAVLVGGAIFVVMRDRAGSESGRRRGLGDIEMGVRDRKTDDSLLANRDFETVSFGNNEKKDSNASAVLFVEGVLRNLNIPEYGMNKFTQKLKDNYLTSVGQLYSLDSSDWRRLGYPQPIEKALREALDESVSASQKSSVNNALRVSALQVNSSITANLKSALGRSVDKKKNEKPKDNRNKSKKKKGILNVQQVNPSKSTADDASNQDWDFFSNPDQHKVQNGQNFLSSVDADLASIENFANG